MAFDKNKKTIAIIGAGITGLSLAWKLSDEFNIILIEKEKQIGGICGSFNKKGITLDYGPHKLYPQTEETLNEIKSLYSSQKDLLNIEKKSKIALQNTLFNYPLEIKQILTKFSSQLAARLIGSYGLSLAKNTFSKKEKKSYKDFIISKFGKGIYSLVFECNARKIWGNPEFLSSDLAKTRISAPNLIKVILNTLIKSDDPKINAKIFYYPKESIQDLMNRIALKVVENKGVILKESQVKKIKLSKNKITSIIIQSQKKRKEQEIDYLISTAHIHESLDLLNAPNQIKDFAQNLKFRDLALVYLFIDKQRALKDNWIFFPEEKYIFQRISEQKSFSEFNQPKDKTAIVAEISIRPEIEKKQDREIIETTIKDLAKTGIISQKEVYDSFVIRKKEIYPIYDLNYKENLSKTLNWLDTNVSNFITCGRNGLFNYNNMDHCVDMAIRISEHLKTNRGSKNMQNLRKHFETYKIVD